MCSECGLVINEQSIDRGPEWYNDNIDTAKRTDAPLTPARHDCGLSTVIGAGRPAT